MGEEINSVENRANVTVANPSHYAGEDSIIEPIDRIANLPFNFGSSYKYMKRLGLKGGENTEERDASAAIWYVVDLVHRLMDEEEGEYRPTEEALSEFDLHEFNNRVHVFAAKVRYSLGLRHAHDPEKDFALAAQDMLVQRSIEAIKIGMSDRQYREYVLEAILVSYYTIRYASSFAPTGYAATGYRGAKSFAISAELRGTVTAVMQRVKDMVEAVYNPRL